MITPRSLVVRNVVVTLATQLIGWVLTFVVTIYLPRYVGDSGLGKISFAMSFVGIFAVLVSLGTSTVLVKEIARDRTRTGELIVAALAIRIPLAVVLGAVAVGSSQLMGYDEVTLRLVMIYSAGMAIDGVNDVLSAALQGQENMTRQSIVVVTGRLLTSLLLIVMVFQRPPIWVFALAPAVAGTVSVVLNLTAFRGLLSTIRLPTRQTIVALVSAGMPYLGWTIFRTLYGQTDPVILKVMTNDATVGWYAAAFRLIGTALFVPSAISVALMPTLSRIQREDTDAFWRMVRRTFALVMLLAIPAGFALIALPEELIKLMHYPPQFLHSIPVLRIGGIGVILYSAASVLGTALVSCDQQHRTFHISIVATVLGIPACFLGAYLTRHSLSNGAIGAMGSDVLLELGIIGAYLRLLPVKLMDPEMYSRCGRYLVACVPIATIGLSTSGSHHLWAIPLSLLFYFGTCWLLRCFGLEEVKSLRTAFGSRIQTAQSA